MNSSRRSLMKAGLMGGLVLTGAAVGASLLPPTARTPREPLRALGPRAFSVLAALSDRICPATPTLPSAWELHVPEKVDTLLHRMVPEAAGDLTQALLLIDNPVAGLLLDIRPLPFTKCSPAQQDQVIRAWQESRLTPRRTAYRALSGLIKASYWSDPAVRAAVGYPGPPSFP